MAGAKGQGAASPDDDQLTVPAEPTIVVQSGRLEPVDGAFGPLPIRNEPLVIGRAKASALCLRDPRVSMAHALVQATPKGIRLRDLRSRNGTFIGSVRVDGEVYVTETSSFRVGDTWLRLVLGEMETVARQGPRHFGQVVGGTDAMLDVFAQLDRWAPKDYSILITGETGTGKDRVAQAIHAASSRRAGPFVAVNCVEFSTTLVEAVLFGHVRGAFTGADSDRPGVFAEADGGTLFVDEIGEIPVELQAKLLRVLQHKEVRPMGGKPRPLNVRTIFATNKDLDRARDEGSFREDLFHRIAEVSVELPPLRHRLDDLPLLVADIGKELERGEVSLEGAALAKLRSLPWRGNVRELHSLVKKVLDGVPHARSRLSLQDFAVVLSATPRASTPALPNGSGSYGVAKDRFERDFYAAKYAEHGGNIQKIADDAGQERSTVRRALRRLGLLTSRTSGRQTGERE
jgi:transcriptional regulator with GAF, ATPase, and Fis domain